MFVQAEELSAILLTKITVTVAIATAKDYSMISKLKQNIEFLWQ